MEITHNGATFQKQLFFASTAQTLQKGFQQRQFLKNSAAEYLKESFQTSAPEVPLVVSLALETPKGQPTRGPHLQSRIEGKTPSSGWGDDPHNAPQTPAALACIRELDASLAFFQYEQTDCARATALPRTAKNGVCNNW